MLTHTLTNQLQVAVKFLAGMVLIMIGWQLLLAVHDIIHVEVKKLMEGATPPNLYYEGVDGDPDKLVIHYESERGLCALMEGLLDGVSEHFGVEVGYEQTACTHQGAERCTFALEFQQAAKV